MKFHRNVIFENYISQKFHFRKWNFSSRLPIDAPPAPPGCLLRPHNIPNASWVIWKVSQMDQKGSHREKSNESSFFAAEWWRSYHGSPQHSDVLKLRKSDTKTPQIYHSKSSGTHWESRGNDATQFFRRCHARIIPDQNEKPQKSECKLKENIKLFLATVIGETLKLEQNPADLPFQLVCNQLRIERNRCDDHYSL